MEKEFFLNEATAHQSTWNYSQIPSSIYNPSWENSMDQNDPFESALSSIVSSPVASSAINGGGGENFMIRELIGRLGSICNSGDISPHSYIGGSTNTSCYNTPLNSPPKLNLSMADPQGRAAFQFSGHHLPTHPNVSPFSADPGFSERAARFSCFNNNGGLNGRIGMKETEMVVRLISRIDSGKFSRVSGNRLKSGGKEGKDGNSIPEKKFNWFSRSSTSENAELGCSREGSTLSEQNPAGELKLKIKADYNSRKRKSNPKGEAKDSKVAEERDESKAKRNKQKEASENEKDASMAEVDPTGEMKDEEDENQKQIKENSKPLEPPKDYIHVRARRGQATDSHSLAERVRREKISKRMKFLQDLVPGCNKVTGKAVMLDEIINYVQSLQRQVEFLSMKLSTINPRLEAMEGLPKDIFQSRGSFPHALHPLDPPVPPFSSGYQALQFQTINGGVSSGTELNLPMNSLNDVFRGNNHHHGYGESSNQVSEFWEDDLHSVVQMGYDQNQQNSFHGSVGETQMKTEL